MPDLMIFVKGAERLRRRVRFQRDRVSVGRASECDLALGHGTLSRQHLEIRRDGDRWVVADLGSSNGTRINGRKIDGPTPLTTGDRIAAGRVRLVISGLDDHASVSEDERRRTEDEAVAAAARDDMALGNLDYDEGDLADCDLFADIDDDDLMDDEPLDMDMGDAGGESVEIELNTMIRNALGEGPSPAELDPDRARAWDDLFGDLEAEESKTDGSTRSRRD